MLPFLSPEDCARLLPEFPVNAHKQIHASHALLNLARIVSEGFFDRIYMMDRILVVGSVSTHQQIDWRFLIVEVQSSIVGWPGSNEVSPRN